MTVSYNSEYIKWKRECDEIAAMNFEQVEADTQILLSEESDNCPVIPLFIGE